MPVLGIHRDSCVGGCQCGPGFKRAWQARDYATIITVVVKIPENVP